MYSKLSVTYTPKRQWKKKRKNRDPHARIQRKKWYRKNKSKLKVKRNKRYKQLRTNPTWKRHQKKMRREVTKRRMIASESTPPVFGIGVGEGIWWGVLQSLDVDADLVRAQSVKTGCPVCISLQTFLEHACFTDPELERCFWAVLESVYGEADP